MFLAFLGKDLSGTKVWDSQWISQLAVNFTPSGGEEWFTYHNVPISQRIQMLGCVSVHLCTSPCCFISSSGCTSSTNRLIKVLLVASPLSPFPQGFFSQLSTNGIKTSGGGRRLETLPNWAATEAISLTSSTGRAPQHLSRSTPANGNGSCLLYRYQEKVDSTWFNNSSYASEPQTKNGINLRITFPSSCVWMH